MEARNELESLTYSMKNQVNDKEKLGSKLTDEEKETILNAVEEKIKFLDDNPRAETEELKQQKKELEEITNPIISKLYQQEGGQQPPPDYEEPRDEF